MHRATQLRVIPPSPTRVTALPRQQQTSTREGVEWARPGPVLWAATPTLQAPQTRALCARALAA